MRQRVQVVVVTCGRPAEPSNCLRALAQRRLPEEISIEIIIAVDGDGDGDEMGEHRKLIRPEGTRCLSYPDKARLRPRARP